MLAQGLVFTCKVLIFYMILMLLAVNCEPYGFNFYFFGFLVLGYLAHLICICKIIGWMGDVLDRFNN
jgi:hypothetical protein